MLYEMNVRQLTPEGTLRAATERLEFLSELGIDALWLMPIYPIGSEGRKGSSGSYYSIKDYCAVNPEMGTIEDFDALLSKAHSLGIHVIMDWVANHTARDARWVDEKPAQWYERDEQGEPLVPWDWTDTAKLNYANHDVWQGQIEAMKFWVARGVDGFRCDMAMLVPIEFWQEASAALHSINSEIFMLAEAEQQNLFDRAFDSCYGWEQHHLMVDVAQGRRRANALVEQLYSHSEQYAAWAIPMAFTSNHDENSWQGREVEIFGDALNAMRLFTFVAPGAMPLLYTGQEVGYDHSFEFFERDPIPAAVYEPNATTEFYHRLIELKHSFESLAAGERGGVWCTINTNAHDCLVALVRESSRDRVVTIINMSPYVVECDFNTGVYAGSYRDHFSGGQVDLPTHFHKFMSGWEYMVLTLKK